MPVGKGGKGGKKGGKKGGAAKGKKGKSVEKSKPAVVKGKNGKSKPVRQSRDVYEDEDFDESEAVLKDQARRYKGVDVYEYEAPEDMDDEEIDSDEAWDSDDFKKWGDSVPQLSGKGGKKGGGDWSDEEEEDDEDDYDDDDDEEEEGSEGGGDGGGIDAIFNHSGSEDDEDALDDDDDDASVDSTRAGNLARAVRSVNKITHAGDTSVARESEFGLVNDSSAPKLGLAALMAPLKGTKDFDATTKKLTRLAANKKKMEVPAPTMVAERVTREEYFSAAKRDLSKWSHKVKQNREADHVSFPLQPAQHPRTSTASMAGTFSATTDFEKELGALVGAPGDAEKRVQQFESLGMNKLSKEEVKKRQAELARMKSLLFHQEIKAKRLKKIKSKKFRKLNKKKDGEEMTMEELEEIDPEAAEERAEREERKRIQARMQLKHRDSKWLNRMLRRGGDKADDGTRAAIGEFLGREKELREKVHSLKARRGSDDDSDGDSSEYDSDDPAGVNKALARLQNDPAPPKKGVAGMAFMTRADDARREESRRLLEEIAAMDAEGGESSDDAVDGKKKAGVTEDMGRRRVGGSATATKATKKTKGDDGNEGAFQSDSSDEGEGDDDDVGVSNRRGGRGSLSGLKGGKAAGVTGMQVDSAAFGGSKALRTSGVLTVGGAAVQASKRATRSSDALELSNGDLNKGTQGKSVLGGASEWGQSAVVGDDSDGSDDGGDAHDRSDENGDDVESDDGDVLVNVAASVAVKATAGQKRSRVNDVKPKGSIVSRRMGKAPARKAKAESSDSESAGDGGDGEGGSDDDANPWLAAATQQTSQSSGPGSRKRKAWAQERATLEAAARRGGTGPGTAKSRRKHGGDEELVDPTQMLTQGGDGEGSGYEDGDGVVVKVNVTDDVDDDDGNNNAASVGMFGVGTQEQRDLVARAFAAPEQDHQEFEEEKEALVEKPKVVVRDAPLGWGSWGGEGVVERRAKEVVVPRKTAANGELLGPERKDAKLANVIINERRNKKAARYQVHSVPHGSGSKALYESTIRQPLGPDWHTVSTHEGMVKPKVNVTAGSMIAPISLGNNKKAKKLHDSRRPPEGGWANKRRPVAT